MATQQYGSGFDVLPYPNNYIELFIEQKIAILHHERAQRPRKAAYGNVIYGEVINKEDLPWIEATVVGTAARFPDRVGTAVDTLATGGADQDFGDLGELLEPGPQILYITAFGIYSDREVEVAVRHGGTTGALYGLKRAFDQRLTPSRSPYRRPRVCLRSYGEQFSPTFLARNNTTVIAGAVKFSFFGHKYEIEELPSEPEHVDKWVSIRQIPEGGGT